MKLCHLTLVFLALRGISLADSPMVASPWRRAIGEEFSFEKVTPAPAPMPRVVEGEAVVELPVLVVEADAVPRGLEEALSRQRIVAPEELTWKGGNLWEGDFFGKRLRVAIPSVLYIPIGVGVGW